MQLTYRRRCYQKKTIPTTVSKIKFSCIYRSVPYQAIANIACLDKEPQEVCLTYRGIPYRRLL